MMEWSAKPENQASKGEKCDKDCLHLSLSWEKGQEPTKAEMIEAAQSFLKSLGMENAQAVFVAHHDTTHQHMHIVASRIDPRRGKTFSRSDDHSPRRKHGGCNGSATTGSVRRTKTARALHRIMDAIEARDGAAIVAALTERTPTFTARELDKALSYGMPDKRGAGEVPAPRFSPQENVIGLREQRAKGR